MDRPIRNVRIAGALGPCPKARMPLLTQSLARRGNNSHVCQAESETHELRIIKESAMTFVVTENSISLQIVTDAVKSAR